MVDDDVSAITATLVAYATAIDTKDWALFRTLFSAELRAMGGSVAEAVLAAADVLTGFESYHLLTAAQKHSPKQARAVLVASLHRLLTSSPTE